MNVRTFWIGSLSLLVLSHVASICRGADGPEFRWLYLQQNLQVKESVVRIEPVLRRAANAGYNGVVLADYKLNILDRVPDHYFDNAKKFQQLCNELKLEIIPSVASFGYSAGILAHDPNLAEGLPAENAPFLVREKVAVPDVNEANLVPGDFEEDKNHTFRGWTFQDEPGKATFADAQIKHSGRSSLRIENPEGAGGNCRVSKLIQVRPWTQFHASVWIRTENFKAAGSARMFAIGDDGRTLSHSNLGVKPDQDWTEHHIVFNSLDNSQFRFYVGVWDCGSGKLWVDDVRLVEEPLVNLVRRPGCPLRVTDADGKTVYEEGRDFQKLRDERLGRTPWDGQFDVYHQPPELRISEGSRIRDGQRLLVSFYHAVTIYDGQVPCSLTEPKVFEIVEDQVKRVNDLFRPKTYFLSHDEIRVANWSESDRASGLSAGEQLAGNVRRCVELIRKINPEAQLCIWSDMFDPAHNARDQFYLVNGDLARSSKGLPKEMIIVNWNSGKAQQSLSYFAERGHRQILAGFYDAPVPRFEAWKKVAQDTGGPQGAMYTTWSGDYSQIEAFAKLAW